MAHIHFDNEKRTKWIVFLTAITMLVEIGFGYWTRSMALLADGWHMGSHVLALGLTWAAYYFSRKYSNSDKITFNKERALALAGFSSAIILQVMAIIMAVESLHRLLNPAEIRFSEAIIVAILGLLINAASAVILHKGHNDDHNIRSAYLHVLADAFTSITAIAALVIGMFYNIYWLDSLSGIICSVVITKWAIDLIGHSAKDLIDFKKKA